MPSPFIGGRIPQELHEALQNHIAESGEKLPQILQKALSSYLSYTPPISSSAGLEERIAFLEISLSSLKEEIEQMKNTPPSTKPKEEQNIPLGQLSLPMTGNEVDIKFDIKETADIEPEINFDINQKDNLDINYDIKVDINKEDAEEQLEIITPQELAEKAGLTMGTVRNYHSTKREVKRDGFIYRPILETEEGKPMWSVEVINDIS